MSNDRSRLISGNIQSYMDEGVVYHGHTAPTGLALDHTLKIASKLLFVIQAVLVVLFATYAKEEYIGDGKFLSIYQLFTGVEIMMFIGFGYLMTFLKRYGMGALGFTMLITVVALQWGILTEAFFAQWYKGAWAYIPVSIDTLVTGLDLVAALLISFGGLIGKISPLQLVIMTLLECVFYSINKSIFLVGALDVIDAGGSIQIHMFGAYFGLAVAYMLGRPAQSAESEANSVSDTFSLIGTLFLFIYWPSFNGGGLEPNSSAQQRAVIATIFALCASTVGTFFASSFLNTTHKFRPVDIQNATLAGGVAIGSVCNLTLSLSDSLLIGFVAGVVSALGFAYMQAWLETSCAVHDTCGIHNLHGLPSLIGGLASVVLCYVKAPLGHDIPAVFAHSNQASIQLAAIAVTLALAVSSGLFSGWLLNAVAALSTTDLYSDAPYWEVEHEGDGEQHGEGHHTDSSKSKQQYPYTSLEIQQGKAGTSPYHH